MIKTETIKIESGERVTMSVETQSELKAVKGQLESIKSEITYFKRHECKCLMDDKKFLSHTCKNRKSPINSEDSEEDLTCRKGCGQVLDNKHNQLIHEKSCTGAKYHQCGTCDHKFQNIHTLQNHMIRCQ